MPGRDFMPHDNATLKLYARQFADRITADPTAVGLTAQDALDLNADVTRFETAFTLAEEPLTRTSVSIVNRTDARRAMVARIRRLSRIIQAHPGTTDPMRESLGLSVRGANPAPQGPPASQPGVFVQTIGARRTRVRLQNRENPDQKAKPRGTGGAYLYAALADQMPQEESAFTFAGAATRHLHTLEFPAGTAGKTVWIIARWFNARGETGPASVPASATIAA